MELTDSSRTFSGELDEKALGYRRRRIHRGEFVRQGIDKGCGIAVADKLTYAGDLERIRGVETEIHLYKADIINWEFLSMDKVEREGMDICLRLWRSPIQDLS